MQRMQQNASEVATDPIDPALRDAVWLRDELRAMGFASEYSIRALGSALVPVAYLLTGITEADVEPPPWVLIGNAQTK